MKKQSQLRAKNSGQQSLFCRNFKTSNLSLTRKFFAFIFTLVLLLGFTGSVNAQTSYPAISQNWLQIFEDESIMMEISVQVIQCDSASDTAVFIEVFNETPNNDTAKFDLTMTNPDNGNTETATISFYIQGAHIERPECGSSDNGSLRLSLPSGWDPEKVELSVTYKN